MVGKDYESISGHLSPSPSLWSTGNHLLPTSFKPGNLSLAGKLQETPGSLTEYCHLPVCHLCGKLSGSSLWSIDTTYMFFP